MNDPANLLFGIAAVPAILGLVQVGKDAGMPSRFAPILAVILGVAAALAQVFASRWSWLPAVVTGIALGLSAAGLYSGTKAVAARTDPAPQAPAPIVLPTVPPTPQNPPNPQV